MKTMRTRVVLSIPFLFFAAILAMAQQAPAGVEHQSLPIVPLQRPSSESFNGSSIVDKPVPEVIHLPILDAMTLQCATTLGLLQETTTFLGGK